MGLSLRIMIRHQLARPSQYVRGHQYNTWVTTHALIMIFFMVMPTLMGGFGNLLVPLQLGKPDMIFARVNVLRFILMVPALMFIIMRMVCEGGRGTR